MMNVTSRKKECCLLAGMLVVLLLLGSVICEAAAPAKARELKWAAQHNETFYSMPAVKQYFTDKVEVYTKGAVKIKIYYAGQLAEIKDLPELCRRGSVDIISTSAPYYPSLYPLNCTIGAFPMLLRSPEVSAYVWRAMFRSFPEIQGEFAKQNQYCLNRSHMSAYLTLSKKPVRNLADFKGLKIRSMPGKYYLDLMAAAGATGLASPISEVYEGLTRGVLDATMANVQGIQTMKFYEPAKYIGYNGGDGMSWFVAINLDLWKSFTPEIKKAFERAADEWGAKDLEVNLTTERQSTEFLKGKGVQFLEFDKKDEEALNRGLNVGDPWVAAKDTLVKELRVDAAVADRFVKRWHELVNEYEQKYSSAGKKWEYK
jgi:TRAP-type C4-dicarboxylate transport system substrate-binding protein